MVRRRCHAPPGRPDDSMTADGTPTEKPEITLESLQERLAINTFHQWLGLELVRVQDGEVEITARWRDELLSNTQRGFANGGILAALIDTTDTFALPERRGNTLPATDMPTDHPHG